MITMNFNQRSSKFCEVSHLFYQNLIRERNSNLHKKAPHSGSVDRSITLNNYIFSFLSFFIILYLYTEVFVAISEFNGFFLSQKCQLKKFSLQKYIKWSWIIKALHIILTYKLQNTKISHLVITRNRYFKKCCA